MNAIAPQKTLLGKPVPAALNISRVMLHILLIINWVYGAAILCLLFASFSNSALIMSALDIPPSSGGLFRGMQAVALLGIVCVPFYYLILRRLIEMVDSVRAGDPFVSENALRLHTIAWALLGLQVLAMVIGAIAKVVSTHEHPLHLDAGFSTSGWLGVLLLFVLARVFAEGARMRDELEGTV
ncbi:MAG: DUF2975 domain-containing protein [Chthoniobacterales bacterium]